MQKVLELPNEKTNVFGGAIALAHPLGMSGARIVANLTHNLRRLDKKYALGAACIGKLDDDLFRISWLILAL